MTDCLLVAGTASHVGKSTLVTGICRALADRGVDVAPYKAQNMSNNAQVVPIAGARDGASVYGEIGVSGFVQARAARVQPTTDVNPVLLKPRGEGESQVVVQGEAVGHYPAGEYYEQAWETVRAAAVESYERLAAAHDVVVAEGAGSIAEINLHDRDLANVETARFADATVVLVGDVERGGVFASLYGTLELMPADVRERVAGVVVNKFRGDPALLEDGVEELEARTGVPVLGVLPYASLDLPEEDSVSLPSGGERAVRGADDGVPDAASVTVAVPRLPHVSNVADFDPLAREPGVRVRYVPLDDDLSGADAVVLPGTKNTVDDLTALRRAGFDDTLRGFSGPVVGICGGYQLLGERLSNAAVEGTTDRETVAGLGLLPVETTFTPEKRVERVTVPVEGVGPLAGATGSVSGYEIHAGESRPLTDDVHRFAGAGAATERVLGTYLHGLFENDAVRAAFLDAVFEAAGNRPPERTASEGVATDPTSRPDAGCDAAADLVERHLPGLLDSFDRRT